MTTEHGEGTVVFFAVVAIVSLLLQFYSIFSADRCDKQAHTKENAPECSSGARD